MKLSFLVIGVFSFSINIFGKDIKVRLFDCSFKEEQVLRNASTIPFNKQEEGLMGIIGLDSYDVICLGALKKVESGELVTREKYEGKVTGKTVPASYTYRIRFIKTQSAYDNDVYLYVDVNNSDDNSDLGSITKRTNKPLDRLNKILTDGPITLKTDNNFFQRSIKLIKISVSSDFIDNLKRID